MTSRKSDSISRRQAHIYQCDRHKTINRRDDRILLHRTLALASTTEHYNDVVLKPHNYALAVDIIFLITKKSAYKVKYYLFFQYYKIIITVFQYLN